LLAGCKKKSILLIREISRNCVKIKLPVVCCLFVLGSLALIKLQHQKFHFFLFLPSFSLQQTFIVIGINIDQQQQHASKPQRRVSSTKVAAAVALRNVELH